MEFDRRTSKVETSGFDLTQIIRKYQRAHQLVINQGRGGEFSSEMVVIQNLSRTV